MMSTVYLSNAVLDQLEGLQTELDRHLVTAASGRCAGCDELEPCTARRTISATFANYRQLPARRPGLAGGHFIKRQRIA